MKNTLVIDHHYVNDQITNLYELTRSYNETHGKMELIAELEESLKDVIDQAIVDGERFRPVDTDRIKRVAEKTRELMDRCPTQDDVKDFFPADYPYGGLVNYPYEIQDFSVRVNLYMLDLLEDGTLVP